MRSAQDPYKPTTRPPPNMYESIKKPRENWKQQLKTTLLSNPQVKNLRTNSSKKVLIMQTYFLLFFLCYCSLSLQHQRRHQKAWRIWSESCLRNPINFKRNVVENKANGQGQSGHFVTPTACGGSLRWGPTKKWAISNSDMWEWEVNDVFVFVVNCWQPTNPTSALSFGLYKNVFILFIYYSIYIYWISSR